MKCLNLAILVQMMSKDAEHIFPAYEAQLSDRAEYLRFNLKEFMTLKDFIINLTHYVSYNVLNDFAYSYCIPQISKEFDLLKITDKSVLNIELKSERTDKLVRQLERNHYYLKSLAKEKIFVFCYIANTKEFLKFDGVNVDVSSLDEVATIIKLLSTERAITGSYDNLFAPKKYLISPFNTPDRFLSGEYFLTDQQEEIKYKIIDSINKKCSNEFQFYRILGESGTGKTLLLYDIAKELAKNYKVCVIHCGLPNEGFEYLIDKLDNLVLLTIKASMLYIANNPVDILIFDESHRIYVPQLNYVNKLAEERNWGVIYGMDPEQTLSRNEEQARIYDRIDELPLKGKYVLSKKIRTNKEIAEFIRILGNLNWQRTVRAFSNIIVMPAYSYDQAKKILSYFIDSGYTYISFTMSKYYYDPLDKLAFNKNTHEVIGQEFDKVVMVLDKKFFYGNDGHLHNSAHPNPNYLFGKLLFQGLTRTREKLALIVIDNFELFGKIINAIKPYGD